MMHARRQVHISQLPDDVLSGILKHLSSKDRVGASLVCKAWKEVEAANPLQPTMLCFFYNNAHEVKWHFRDTRCLQELHMGVPSIANFLPLRRNLDSLRILRLDSFMYTYEQAESLVNIQCCRSLQTISLEDWRPANPENPAGHKLDGAHTGEGSAHTPPIRLVIEAHCRLKAGESLRIAISMLPQLTHLCLKKVDIQDPDGLHDLHPWTQLRSLWIQPELRDYNGHWEPIYAGFRIGGDLGRTTKLTQLCIMVPFVGKQQTLEALTGLQSLTIHYEPMSCGPLTRHGQQPEALVHHPFKLLTAAKLTKLHFMVCKPDGASLEDMLPLESLSHVKELIMEHPTIHPWDSMWAQWPMSWSRLTTLTSLTCFLGPNNVAPYFPAVLNSMTSLRKVVIKHQTQEYVWDEDLEAHVPTDFEWLLDQALSGTHGLTQLTSLIVDDVEQLGSWRQY